MLELAALDPSSSSTSHLDAIRAVLRERRPAVAPELLAFARRVHCESPDESLRLEARNVLAGADVLAGDDDAAATGYREVLERTWGSSPHAERAACVNLAMIVTRQRRLVEAFALARRACQVALDSGDPLGACLSHAQLAKVLQELGDSDGFARAVATAQALEIIRAALVAGPTEPGYRMRFEAEELLCLADLDDAEALRDRDAGCLARMIAAGRDADSATWRMRVGETAGSALARDPDARTEARLAFEIAAVAALVRSWETKLFLQEFPQLERMDAEDIALLEAHSERFAAKHRDLLATIRALVRDGARLSTTLPDDSASEFFVAACAWCHQVRGPERVWIPVDQFVVRSQHLAITHGICPDCTNAVLASRPSAREHLSG